MAAIIEAVEDAAAAASARLVDAALKLSAALDSRVRTLKARPLVIMEQGVIDEATRLVWRDPDLRRQLEACLRARMVAAPRAADFPQHGSTTRAARSNTTRATPG